MKYTKNYGFKKPEPQDTRNINDINDSFDLVDQKLKETQDKNTNLDATFQQLIINAGSSNAEIVAGRRDNVTGETFESLPKRLDKHSSLLAQIGNQKAEKIEVQNVQSQVNALVVGSGTSSAEVVQGRVNNKGYIFDTVKSHYDFEEGRLEYGKNITLGTTLYSGVLNGGVISNTTLTIPSGKLGGGSYIGYIFGIKKELSNKSIIIEINLEHSSNMTNYEGRYSGAPGIEIEINKNNLNKIYMKLTIGALSADTSVRLMAFCINYTTPLTQDGTITLDGYKAYRYDKLNELKEDISEDIINLNQTISDINIRLNNSNDIVDKRTLNLFDKTKINTLGYYNASGAFINDGSYLNDSGEIEVNINKTYHINRLGSSQPIWNFFKSDGTWVLSQSNVGYSVKVPNNELIKIMRVALLKTEIDSAMITEGVPTYGKYYPFNAPEKYLKTRWYGKKSATIGDSIYQAGYWQPALVNVLGLDNTIIAQSGGNMTAIANFINQLTADIELLIIGAGTNDFFNSTPLGTLLNGDKNTYYGSVQYVCEYISSNFPDMKILFTTPFQRYSSDMSTWAMNNKGYYINPTTGLTLENYANAMMETANLYGFKVVDMYHESGINRYNISNFSNDKLHLTREAWEEKVWQIIEAVKTI